MPAAHHLRKKPADQSQCRPHRRARRARFPPTQVAQPLQSCEQGAVKNHAQSPAQHAQNHPKRHAAQRRRLEMGRAKLRQLPQHQAGNHVARHAGHKRNREHAGRKVALHFFQHKHKSRQRRVKGRRQTRSGARRDEVLAFARGRTQLFGDHLPQRAAHLHRRPFAAQGQTGANGQKSAHELDRHHALPSQWSQSVQNQLEMRDAATGGFGRKKRHHRHAHAHRHSAQNDANRQSPPKLVAQVEEIVAPVFGEVEHPAKGDRDQTS